MCGICGLWDLNDGQIDPALLVGMRDRMQHRGPDGKGCVIIDTKGTLPPLQFENPETANMGSQLANGVYSMGMAHRRLSIIDLNTGDQPMRNEDGNLWIVYNGEIYNFREIRSSLEGCGHTFHTQSDTEVILHAYEEYGENCPALFNGIFAFAIWDSRNHILFLARDHFGVKPLYYTLQQNRFYFASEVKSILADPRIQREVDLDAINMVLTFRHTPSPWTPFKNIQKLSPGCSLTVSPTGIHKQAFWNNSKEIDRVTTEKEWVEQLSIAMQIAVKRQMISDVPVGVSLSSGVDSTAILALMSQGSREPVKAFTVGFAGRESVSEVEPARGMAKIFGADFFHKTIQANEYANFMQRYMWHLEEPIGNESAAAYYFVAEMAHQEGIKVLINGQGADEPFAGYERSFFAAYSRILRMAAIPPIPKLVNSLLAGSGLGERFQRLLYTLKGDTEEESLLLLHSIISNSTRSQLFRSEVFAKITQDLPQEIVHNQLQLAPTGTFLERMAFVDTRTSLPDDLLLCEDKMAMAAGVEARVPFLDLDFMAIAEKIPGKYKLRFLRDKYIFRKACGRWVGKDVVSRKKIGFDNAVDIWLRHQLGSQLIQLVSSDSSFTSKYLNKSHILTLMKEHLEGQRDHQRILFLIYSLESWYQVFFSNPI